MIVYKSIDFTHIVIQFLVPDLLKLYK